MARYYRSPLDTDYANAGIDHIEAFRGCSEEVYTRCQNVHEMDGARVTEMRWEDRFIAAMTGATTSEIWGL